MVVSNYISLPRVVKAVASNASIQLRWSQVSAPII
jgi:hypothetical protein